MLLTRGRVDRSGAAVKVRPHFCHNRSYRFSHEPILQHGLLRQPMAAREEDTKSIGDTLPRPRLPASLSPFRYPMFRAIWLATLMSNLGVWIQSVGAAWLMTSITDSAPMVALVQSATALPVLLFSLFGGALADLWDRRLVFMTGQIIVLSGATLIAVLQGV